MKENKMSDDLKTTPQSPTLTLDPVEAPSPGFDAFTEAKPVVTLKEYTETIAENVNLTPEEQKQIDDFAQTIDIHNSSIIMQYGAGAQKKLSSFSENALLDVRAKDMGEIGNMLTSLVGELRNFDVSDEKGSGLFGMFKKGSNKVSNMKAKYSTAEKNVADISAALERHQITLMKDVAVLDKMYDQNVVYFKELTMYILAGKKKLKEVETVELPALKEKARITNLPEDAQAANDLSNLCDRFAKKLHDLELTRTISIQMAPQIRLIQNSDTLMTEKIQSTLVNTIPLWKSQMVLSLGIQHSQQAAKAQREVTDMTNELLRKNSESLKMATIETARESERGIVDIETLKTTNQNLIDSLDEVVKIQNEGRQKRAEAEVELARIEGDLKTKLLDMQQQ